MPGFNSADGEFPVTQWSLVARAGAMGNQCGHEALGALLAAYLPPMRAHLVYRKGLSPEAAEDMLQEFIAGKVLEKNLIARADRNLGKFRTFLLTALDRFAFNRFRDERAAKRSPGALAACLDQIEACVADDSRHDDVFDIAWARQIIHEALRQMRRECEQSRRCDLWGVFECRVAGPILEGTEPVDYRQLVQRFGFQSPMQATNALVTAKRMFVRALREIVRSYARDEAEIDEEIDDLYRVLAGSGRI